MEMTVCHGAHTKQEQTWNAMFIAVTFWPRLSVGARVTSRVIVGSQVEAPARGPLTDSRVWRLVGGAGALFLLAGLIDIGLAVLPANLGDRPQRFGTLVGILSGWPILALGAVAIQVAAAGLESAVLRRLSVVIHAVGLVVLVAAVGMLLLDRGPVAQLAGQAAVSIQRGFVRGLASATSFLAVHVVGLVTRPKVLL